MFVFASTESRGFEDEILSKADTNKGAYLSQSQRKLF